MARYSRHSMASAFALAIGLSACGGGGSGGPQFTPAPATPTPTPPATPTPTPPPTPTPAGTVGSLAAPTVPATPAFPVATPGGPTMASHPTTTYPLVGTIVTLSAGGATSNATLNAGGASLTIESTGNTPNGKFGIAVPGGNYNVALNAGGWYCYGTACGDASDGRYFELYIPQPDPNYTWTSYGSWAGYTQTSAHLSSFVTGYVTPAASIPTSGTATFTGVAEGQVLYPLTGGWYGLGVDSVFGTALLQANFGTAAITGSLTSMTAGGVPWNSVSLQGTIVAGISGFSGTTAVTTAPAGVATLNSSATGTFAGRFFGPSAQELGAVWTLHDGTKGAYGTIRAKGP